MSCQNNNECTHNQCNEGRCGNGGNSFVCIIVLYILLAIIIGSFVY